MERIKLVKDTIDMNDINLLIEWLKTNPILTKNKLTIEFEEKFSKYQNKKYSVFLNSGSSANLAMIYSLLISGICYLKKQTYECQPTPQQVYKSVLKRLNK